MEKPAPRPALDALEVIAFPRESRRRLVAAARSIPRERWGGPVTCPWGATGGVEDLLFDMSKHEQHHGAQIRGASAPDEKSA